ncbi:MAG TPA: carboxypeptidase regulatory-like domain-containing protein [Edaphobacter sp.]|nr:carboxypeptidase regulatory-like domain-containing protein [Edaphobacter sp.]
MKSISSSGPLRSIAVFCTTFPAVLRTAVSRIFAVILIAGAMMLAARPAIAQNTGSIFGTVQDTTGAVIPGALVTAMDPAHATTRAVKSNGSGEFTITGLPIGTYTLTTTSAQFENSVITGIRVDANSDIKKIVKMVTGSTTASVTVVDDSSSAIDAKSATLGTMIDEKLIEDLPIDGHNVVALTALLPGVVDVNAPATFTGDTGGPTFSASGSRNTQNLFLFDGLMWNNLFYNTGINYPPPNSLQEVSVVLNNYKAEYGRNAGSVVNVVTRSGTNQVHGSAWDYIQNQAFNASDYLSHVNPKDNINQFGFTVGGPILKDKLFFFGAFQDLIGHLLTTGSVPFIGYAERGLNPDGVTARPCDSAGPFPGMTCASFLADATGGKIINPENVTGSGGNQVTPANAEDNLNAAYRQAGGVGSSPCIPLLILAKNFQANVKGLSGTQQTFLPSGEVPTQCLNPVMLKVVNTFVPATSNSVGGLAATTSNKPEGDKNMLVRGDYHPSDRHSFDVRYNYINSSALGPLGVNSSSLGVSPYAIASQKAVSNFANLGWTWVMSPNLLNRLRFGYKRFEASQLPTDHRTLADFGGNFIEPGIPTLPAFSFSNQFSLGSTGQGFQDHINENIELAENITWTKGNHTVQGGFSFLRLQYLTRQDYPGQISFSSTYTGVSFADGMMGLATSVQAQNRLIQGGIQHTIFSYIQDDWRLTSKLTLNLGLRYELPFQWFEPHGEAATFIPGIQSTVFPGAVGGLGFPGDKGVLPSLVPTDYNGVAPRFGFAYDVTGQGKLLVRGGFGIFFDAVNANVVGVGEPYNFIFLIQTPPGGASVPLLESLGGPIKVVPPAFDPKNPQFVAPYSIFFPDRNFRTPYSEAVNFGFEYRIPHGGTLDTNYVGKFARKLTVPLDLNPAIYDCSGGYFQADPAKYCNNASSATQSTQARLRYAPFNFGGQGIVDLLSIGTSSYNALQMQYTQRGGRYLNVLSSYTFSRAIDVDTNGQTTSNAVPDVFNIRSDRGLSDNNATHIFSLGWVVRYPKVGMDSRIVRAVLNDWVYSGTYQAHSGRPFSVTINNDSALDGEVNQRAALVPGANPLLSSSRHRLDKVNEYFNIDAFTYPTVGTFSPVGRNAFIGPAYIMTNMTVGRDFPMARVREGMRLNFRVEGYNVFNTPNLGQPQAKFSCSTTSTNGGSCTAAGGSYPLITGTNNPTFGSIRNTFGNNSNTSTNGRKLQFAATLFF